MNATEQDSQYFLDKVTSGHEGSIKNVINSLETQSNNIQKGSKMFDALIYAGLFHTLDEANNHDNGISQSKIDDIHTKMKQDLANVKSEKLADIVSAYCDAAYLAVSEQEELMKNNPGLLRRIKPDPQAQADWVKQAIEEDFIIPNVIGQRRLAGKYIRPLEIYCRHNFAGDGTVSLIASAEQLDQYIDAQEERIRNIAAQRYQAEEKVVTKERVMTGGRGGGGC